MKMAKGIREGRGLHSDPERHLKADSKNPKAIPVGENIEEQTLGRAKQQAWTHVGCLGIVGAYRERERERERERCLASGVSAEVPRRI